MARKKIPGPGQARSAFNSASPQEAALWSHPNMSQPLLDTLQFMPEAKQRLVAEGVDPYGGMPTGPDDPNYEDSQAQLNEIADAFEMDSDEYFDESDSGYFPEKTTHDRYKVKKIDWRDPAPITDVPTNTSDPFRPRTVAAGYDKARQVITVVFRDGTFYNYYDCTPRIWQAFKMSRSKGRYILKELNGHDRGFANANEVPVTVRAALYNVARVKQITGNARWQQESLYKLAVGREAAKANRGTQGRKR